ncbi:hypothetical protein FHS29_007074 [Saccharothrix tamanrassetensis]|uniref:Secreted protein n=1 Tax=Saccharothrix tamanrassetensis TaxID=1051531 RepID=A0A841CT47_9PSEU|nr:hypothetical protein [Saccharothrix tamanrassetensis]MBB5960450.1 hypothetical protein [Saccharothrix tamanrassetensis]
MMKVSKSSLAGVAGAACLVLASPLVLAGTSFADQEADITVDSVTLRSDTDLKVSVTYSCSPYNQEDDDAEGPINNLVVITHTAHGNQYGSTAPVCDGRSHTADVITHHDWADHDPGDNVTASATLANWSGSPEAIDEGSFTL